MVFVSVAFAGVSMPSEPEADNAWSTTLRLNELFPWPNAGDPEWVEIINISSAPIGLIGWHVEGTRGQTPITFALGHDLLAPGGLVVVNTPTIMNNLPPGSMKLLAPDGVVVDSFSYESLAMGKAWGRRPDGTGDWSPLLDPSPGVANSPSTATPTTTATPTRYIEPTETTTVAPATLTVSPATEPTEPPTAVRATLTPTSAATATIELSHTPTASASTFTATPTVELPTASSTFTPARSSNVVLNEVMPVPDGAGQRHGSSSTMTATKRSRSAAGRLSMVAIRSLWLKSIR